MLIDGGIRSGADIFKALVWVRSVVGLVYRSFGVWLYVSSFSDPGLAKFPAFTRVWSALY